jgi:hypothetical protein
VRPVGGGHRGQLVVKVQWKHCQVSCVDTQKGERCSYYMLYHQSTSSSPGCTLSGAVC